MACAPRSATGFHVHLRLVAKARQPVTASELDAVAVCLAEGLAPPQELICDDLGAQTVLLVASCNLVYREADLATLSQFPWVMNENGCGFRAYIRQSFEAAQAAFSSWGGGSQCGSSECRWWRAATASASSPGPPRRRPLAPRELRSSTAQTSSRKCALGCCHRPPAGRLARPIEVFRNALIEGLDFPMPLLS